MAKNLNWEAIKHDYRLGQLSNVQIGKKHGCSHTIVGRKAAEEGWERDLMGQVVAETHLQLLKLDSDSNVSEVAGVSGQRIQDRDLINAAARASVEVVRTHRQDIAKTQRLIDLLFTELTESTEHRDEINETIEAETEGDPIPYRRNMMQRAVSLGSRAQVLKSLVDAQVKLIGCEREAFSLDKKLDPRDMSTEQLYELAKMAANG